MIPAEHPRKLCDYPRLHQGKVREIHAADADHVLIVASDRISAFDVVLPTPVPGKGVILTQLSNFWFRFTEPYAHNHLTDDPLTRFIDDPAELARLQDRCVVARRYKPLPIEAIVRGYLTGSAWTAYRTQGKIGGIRLPAGLRLAERLAEPIFTPSTKAPVGLHDINIDFDQTTELIGGQVAEQVRSLSLEVYRRAERHALERDILLADTKLEMAVDDDGQLVIIDELLTPDSSRFWAAAQYRVGDNPPSFDKQFVRDYLTRSGWNKQPPAPALPDDIVQQTLARYREALTRLILTNEDCKENDHAS